MPATRYKIWQVENSVGRGVVPSVNVGVAGVAKPNKPDHPHTIANELVCGHLARAILLPVPPGFVIELEGTPHYVSLDFNLAGEDLPPIVPKDLVRAHPTIACGALLFDMWVANRDRHVRNLAHDTASGRVTLFDHGHAFLAGRDGRANLNGALGAWAVEEHCLVPELTDIGSAQEWIDRIGAVPRFYIQGVVEAAVEVGLPPEDVDFCVEYLLVRREELKDVLLAHQGRLPNVAPHLWEYAERPDEAGQDGRASDVAGETQEERREP